MNRRALIASALTLATLAVSSSARARRALPVTPPVVRFLSHTRDVAGAATTVAALATQLRADAPGTGATIETPAGTAQIVTIHLASPLPVRTVLGAYGWNTAYAVSGDVHQQTWSVMLATGQLSPTRIATEFPHIGGWDVRIMLSARPTGALPTIVAGASPAYDLSQYPATVSAIEFAPHR